MGRILFGTNSRDFVLLADGQRPNKTKTSRNFARAVGAPVHHRQPRHYTVAPSWRTEFIRFRRALGLLAFFYACAHMMVYLPVALDQREDLRGMVSDILSKPFIAIGMLAFLILVPLAVTSNAPMIKRLGVSAWQNLHRWVYVAAIAATVHFLMAALMASKTGTLAAEQLAYPALIAALLLIRVILAARKRWSSAVPRTA